jgi:hypothetical protein
MPGREFKLYCGDCMKTDPREASNKLTAILAPDDNRLILKCSAHDKVLATISPGELQVLLNTPSCTACDSVRESIH